MGKRGETHNMVSASIPREAADGGGSTSTPCCRCDYRAGDPRCPPPECPPSLASAIARRDWGGSSGSSHGSSTSRRTARRGVVWCTPQPAGGACGSVGEEVDGRLPPPPSPFPSTPPQKTHHTLGQSSVARGWRAPRQRRPAWGSPCAPAASGHASGTLCEGGGNGGDGMEASTPTGPPTSPTAANAGRQTGRQESKRAGRQAGNHTQAAHHTAHPRPGTQQHRHDGVRRRPRRVWRYQEPVRPLHPPPPTRQEPPTGEDPRPAGDATRPPAAAADMRPHAHRPLPPPVLLKTHPPTRPRTHRPAIPCGHRARVKRVERDGRLGHVLEEDARAAARAQGADQLAHGGRRGRWVGGQREGEEWQGERGGGGG